MMSHDVNNHGASGEDMPQAKKPWSTPSLQVIALQSAEGGTHGSTSDGVGAHFNRPRS